MQSCITGHASMLASLRLPLPIALALPPPTFRPTA